MLNSTKAGLLLLGVLHLSNGVPAELPNQKLTPGATRITTLTDVCTTKTSLVRNVTDSTKKLVFNNYGLNGNDKTQCSEGYEIDHLISLELGGSNDPKNLWPQSYCGSPYNAKIKDKLENELHRQVCLGKISLESAQLCISKDWEMCYIKIYKK